MSYMAIQVGYIPTGSSRNGDEPSAAKHREPDALTETVDPVRRLSAHHYEDSADEQYKAAGRATRTFARDLPWVGRRSRPMQRSRERPEEAIAKI